MIRLVFASVSVALMATGAAWGQDEGGLQFDTADAALTEAPQPLPAESEVLNNTPFGDWLVSCDAVSVSRVVCVLQQTLTVTETGQLVVRMLALPADDGGAILLAQVPIGVFLPTGPVFRLARGEDEMEEGQRDMVWQRCLGQICEAAVQLSAADMAAMADHDRMLFGYQIDPAAEPVIVGLDIASFTDGIAAIRPEG